MAVLNMYKGSCSEPVSTEHISLREERRRTGRYIAAGSAIFLSLLGLYQALIQGTPEYAALFAPAVIMFVYLLWILYASRNQNARLLRLTAAVRKEISNTPSPLVSVEVLSEKVENGKQPKKDYIVTVDTDSAAAESPKKKKSKGHYSRSYSIA